ncbi:MAG: MarR family transcriptional regulator [Armatimonadota bacterium]
MNKNTLSKNSVEYLEILSAIFAELVRKAASAREPEASEDITPSLIQCLQHIYLHGPSSIRKIATGLSITFSAASQLVERLVRKGLATREESKKDRRFASVNLTDEGRSVVMEARAARSRWLRDIFDKIPDDRRETLVDNLEEFILLALETRESIEEACVMCGIDHLAFCVVNRASISKTGEPLGEY